MNKYKISLLSTIFNLGFLTMLSMFVISKEQLAKINEERFRLALEGANDGLWDYDIITRSAIISRKCKEMLGYSNDDINDVDDFVDLIHPEYIDFFYKNIRRHYNGETEYFSFELKIRNKVGNYIWMMLRGKAVFNKEQIPVRMAGSLTDISIRKNSEEIIYDMAYYDILTGLPNRVLFDIITNEAIFNKKNYNQKIGIIFLDVNNFKTYNDFLGHYFGDMLLNEISKRLLKFKCENIELARLSGDEFAFIIKGIYSENDLTKIADKIINSFYEPVELDNKQFYITVSIGISIYPYDGENVSTLMRNADTALHYAKKIGKNTYQIHNKIMNNLIEEKLKLESDLRRAINHKEFLVFYQPKVDIFTNKIIGMEALVRWDKPDEGLISPIKFIPLAEETGLIVPIGLEVLREACIQNKQWQESGYEPIRVAVNLSIRQLQQKNLVENIEEILAEASLDPQYLELEITESIAMDNFECTRRMLNELQFLGINISLDDFGTGYSSLNYLKKLPIDAIKIDKIFIDDINISKSGESISKAVITMAHSFNINVVAEGVEKEKQLELLKEQGCDIYQGYLFSKPVSADDFEKLLVKQ